MASAAAVAPSPLDSAVALASAAAVAPSPLDSAVALEEAEASPSPFVIVSLLLEAIATITPSSEIVATALPLPSTVSTT